MNEKKGRLDKVRKDLESRVVELPLIKRVSDVIFGEGNPNAEIIFIGEAGGYWEAKLRRPFVGNAGKLLNQLINSIRLEREDVYITNVVKTRPPNNRDPSLEEIEAFRPYLDQEIEIIDPKIIVTLGRFSLNKFLPGEYISQVHGQARYVEFAGKKRIVLPMYHPAAALRNGGIMVQLRQDFKKIADFLGKKIEEKEEKEEKESQLTLI